MSDLNTEAPAVPELDAWLLAVRPPHPSPDLALSVMAAVGREPQHSMRDSPASATGRAPVWGAPPPLISGGALWRPALAMVAALALATLLLALWSGTPAGERWVPLLLATVESPLFPWIGGTLLACAAAIAVPMAWMEA